MAGRVIHIWVPSRHRAEPRGNQRKPVLVGICLVIIVAGASFIPGQAQEASQASAVPQQAANNNVPPTQNWAAGNPLKIALLKWYQANLTTSFKVGKQPLGVVFDGANIWVAN